MQNGNSMQKHAQHCLLKIVFDMIAFRNQYLVNSVNLAFTHALLQSVYNDVAASNVIVNLIS